MDAVRNHGAPYSLLCFSDKHRSDRYCSRFFLESRGPVHMKDLLTPLSEILKWPLLCALGSSQWEGEEEGRQQRCKGKDTQGGPRQRWGAYTRTDSPAERPKGGRNWQSCRGSHKRIGVSNNAVQLAYLLGRCLGPNFKLKRSRLGYTALSVALSVDICVRVRGGQVT